MKLALVATIVSAVGIIWGAVTIVTKTPYWWGSIILGIALFFGLYAGVRLQDKTQQGKTQQEKSKKDK